MTRGSPPRWPPPSVAGPSSRCARATSARAAPTTPPTGAPPRPALPRRAPRVRAARHHRPGPDHPALAGRARSTSASPPARPGWSWSTWTCPSPARRPRRPRGGSTGVDERRGRARRAGRPRGRAAGRLYDTYTVTTGRGGRHLYFTATRTAVRLRQQRRQGRTRLADRHPRPRRLRRRGRFGGRRAGPTRLVARRRDPLPALPRAWLRRARYVRATAARRRRPRSRCRTSPTGSRGALPARRSSPRRTRTRVTGRRPPHEAQRAAVSARPSVALGQFIAGGAAERRPSATALALNVAACRHARSGLAPGTHWGGTIAVRHCGRPRLRDDGRVGAQVRQLPHDSRARRTRHGGCPHEHADHRPHRPAGCERERAPRLHVVDAEKAAKLRTAWTADELMAMDVRRPGVGGARHHRRGRVAAVRPAEGRQVLGVPRARPGRRRRRHRRSAPSPSRAARCCTWRWRTPRAGCRPGWGSCSATRPRRPGSPWPRTCPLDGPRRGRGHRALAGPQPRRPHGRHRRVRQDPGRHHARLSAYDADYAAVGRLKKLADHYARAVRPGPPRPQSRRRRTSSPRCPAPTASPEPPTPRSSSSGHAARPTACCS